MPPENTLNLNYKYPIVASDGHTILITEEGPVNLIFFQMRGQSPQGVNADVVAAVRLHNLAELKQLNKVIGDTIKKHETREK